ncbi:Cytochrome P450 [Escovopsis weberi]|uniref:Cytochrome P450 n=1 Tax=Escovopsis weberi TaxID=150374 RepID=A0A0N0RT28_ESCWE|nr:Cytochrome P450 [Escovopsis weberi]
MSKNFDKLLGRDMGAHFKGVFRKMTNKSDLSVTLPGLIQEADARFRSWNISGPLDPFSNMFPLIYSMIHRGIGCLDMALKPEETILTFFTMIVSSPTGVMFPTLPTPSSMLKMWSTIRIYRLVMIDNGDSNLIMFLYLAGAVSVALANTSMQVAWLQCFLASDPYWYARTRAEVDKVVAKNRVSADETPVDVLLRLTLDQWENDFPTIHAGLTDSIRMVLPGPSIRKNISGKDLVMGKTGVVVPPDAFVLYAFHDIHFDPSIYKDPYKWDPSRYLDGEQDDKKAPPHSYLGWGSGLHPCLGMKLAKLFVTITTAMFVSHFDFKLTDEKGTPSTEPLPLPGMNGREALGPVTGVFLKCERRF